MARRNRTAAAKAEQKQDAAPPAPETIMRLTVPGAALRAALATCRRGIDSGTVHPILNNFLFELDDGVLSVTGADLQTRISVAIPGAEADNILSFLLPPRVAAVLATSAAEKIRFELDSAFGLRTTADRRSIAAATAMADDFPTMPPGPEDDRYFDLSPAAIAAILQVEPLVAESHTRKSGLSIVSTVKDFSAAGGGDSSMARARVDSCGLWSASISCEHADLLRALNPKQTARIAKHGSNLWIKQGAMTLVLRTLDASAHDYERFFDECRVQREGTIGKDELVAAVKALAAIEPEDRRLTLLIASNLLTLRAKGPHGSVEELVPCEWNAQATEINLSTKLLSQALAVVRDERPRFSLRGRKNELEAFGLRDESGVEVLVAPMGYPKDLS
ncbi:MAG: hypothetical protein JNK05_34765 [Myxococcales bacterium]|nr:hypothetical protein [Myxococcales bacterium]